jgi:hypothetical protein
MVAEVERLGIEVVGDLGDLVPAARPAAGSVDPGGTTEADLLAAASRGLVGLAPAFNQLRAERDELRRSARRTSGDSG